MHKASVAQVVIPHRVFAPSCHLHKAESTLLPLLPFCLAAAHSVLGIHPFSRLDVLIVPAGFSSLGMARYVSLVSINAFCAFYYAFYIMCKIT